MKTLSEVYRGRRVLLTGHTGFKGAWLSLWLRNLGAEVLGYALKAETQPSHWELLQLDMESIIADIRDGDSLEKTVQRFKPELVIHMAAQPLVRLSFSKPVDTFETNVMGTVNLLNACKNCDSVRAIVNITSDKCYENRELMWGYRESDPMGGHDPYSASKGCAELVASSWRNSFFPLSAYGDTHNTLLASARSGNVIGGGDWNADRLIPDLVKSMVHSEAVPIRSPGATRPWQHVLDPLYGYLRLGEEMLQGNTTFSDGWNFGPQELCSLTVLEVAKIVRSRWEKLNFHVDESAANLHEATELRLDSTKAFKKLRWTNQWNAHQAISAAIDWYRSWYESHEIISSQQLESYTSTLQRENS